MNNVTIAAISTPLGSGGIGIIRISGDRAIEIGTRFFQRTRRSDPASNIRTGDYTPHRLHHGHIIDPRNRQPVDEVLLVVMPAPRSYTREDVVEIHSHSGPVVLGHVFEKVLSAGAEIAQPGEFTKRAFLNGRIDLAQAEAVADIIQAKTETALRMANRQLAGELTAVIDRLGKKLQRIHVAMEAVIDFPEDVDDAFPAVAIAEELRTGVVNPIDQLLRNYHRGHFFRDGVKMAVIGRPNVGKSSLMNRLLERDRAIVTAIPGTTRDVIEETFQIRGLPMVIMDTAGLHDAGDEIEKAGILKTRQSIEQADLILFVVDSSQPLTSQDLAIYKDLSEKPHLLVCNKIDLKPSQPETCVDGAAKNAPCVPVSAKIGTNVERLKKAIWRQVVGDHARHGEMGLTPNLRHKKDLEACLLSARRARSALLDNQPLELVSTDIMECRRCLDRISGVACPAELLDQIFSRFCIGK